MHVIKGKNLKQGSQQSEKREVRVSGPRVSRLEALRAALLPATFPLGLKSTSEIYSIPCLFIFQLELKIKLKLKIN